MKHIFTVGIAVAILTGCSSAPKLEIAAGTTQIKQYGKNQFDLPAWYVEIPSEQNTIFATATEVSSDLQFSLDKAHMSANREIAFKLSNEVSQKVREHSTESNFGDVPASKMTERLMVAESNHVNVVGSQRIKTHIVREGDKYRAFVLVRYALNESNKIHMNYISKQRAQDASRELTAYEKELNQKRTTQQ